MKRSGADPAKGGRAELPYMGALDGLRGLAVLAILLFHAGHLRGGWLGVDLFFVLSGFLITSLLLVEHEASGRVSLASFWRRRGRRLLPALLALLFGVCGYAAVVAQPEELARIRADVIATLFYVANWHSILAGHDYWEIFRFPSPLDHTWSLAIEEQFYLAWPLLFLWIARTSRGSCRWIAAAAAGLALLSAGWMAWLYDPEDGTARVYYGTDTRIAATLVGAAIAAAFRGRIRAWPPPRRPLGDALAASALLLLGAAAVWLGGSSPVVYRGGLFAMTLASGAVIVGLLLAPDGPAARGLSLAPLRWLGLVSYGVYLWHWPLYLTLTPERVGLDGASLTALRIAVTLVVSGLSYVALEQPVRRGRLPARTLWGGALAASAGVLACAWLVTGGSTPDESPSPQASSAGRRVDLMLLGDSVAARLRTAFPEEARARGHEALVIASEGCGSLRSTRMRFLGGQRFSLVPCLRVRQSWRAAVGRLRPAAVVLLEGWSGEGWKKVGDRWLHPCQPAFDAAYAQDLEALVGDFGQAGAATLLVSLPPPIAGDLSPNYANLWGETGTADLQRLFDERMACLNRVRSRVAGATGATLVDLAAQVCPGGRCRSELHGFRVRPDGMHFSGESAAWVARWLLDRAESVAPGLSGTGGTTGGSSLAHAALR